jgi:tol-pal system protein YbgF
VVEEPPRALGYHGGYVRRWGTSINFWTAASTLAAVAASLYLGGCVSGSDIDALHRHIGDVEKKVDTVAAQSSSKEEVQRLNENLTKQVATLLRANADVGARFDDLIREMQTLAGKLEDTNRRLSQVSQQIAVSSGSPAVAAPPPTSGIPPAGAVVVVPPPGGAGRSPSPSDLFTQATADYQRGQYELARQGFEEYVSSYPKTDLSDDALYWAGECYAAQKKPKEAIAEWDKLFAQYPQSDKAAAAHLKKALAHLDLSEKAQAIVQLQFVVHEYPGSDEAKSARQRLRSLGSDAR